jgi:hypothetical protein
MVVTMLARPLTTACHQHTQRLTPAGRSDARRNVRRGEGEDTTSGLAEICGPKSQCATDAAASSPPCGRSRSSRPSMAAEPAQAAPTRNATL